jgi:hypothetical protein
MLRAALMSSGATENIVTSSNFSQLPLKKQQQVYGMHTHMTVWFNRCPLGRCVDDDEGTMEKAAGSLAAARIVPAWGLHEGKGVCIWMIC